MTSTCALPVAGQRRLFWATQAGGCGSETNCIGVDCGQPGLSYGDTEVCGNHCRCCAPAIQDPNCPVHSTTPKYRSISTANWIQGLIINMLMTDGRKQNVACGFRPGAQGGHWSESFIQSGDATIGTLMREIPTTGSIRDSINLVTAFAKATLERLVIRGIAISIDVASTYLGNGLMKLDISVIGTRGLGDTRVGVSVQRLDNAWIWGELN